jgi:hypothetical protein
MTNTRRAVTAIKVGNKAKNAEDAEAFTLQRSILEGGGLDLFFVHEQLGTISPSGCEST